MRRDAVIGIDLDNTLVTYDDLFHALAVERRLIDELTPKYKRGIRDVIREGADGEQQWRELQSLAYGARMHDAALVDGVAVFLLECRRGQVPVEIISHRTERAAADPLGTNLRDAALAWMRERRFFERDGLGLDPSRVWFEPTRAEKVARIRSRACTHFVDDLEEVFLEPSFPDGVVKILYAPDRAGVHPAPDGVRVVDSWPAIGEVIFGGR